uniref:Uncharacterized protein n=1 Tax=viral metagenome TaxID=1070528 RepID=A0A6C0KT22_9ZZZZ
MLSLIKRISPSLFRTSVFQNANYLGRWKLENENKTYLKADYANNDHCSCSHLPTEDNTYDDVDDYSPFLVEFVQDYSKQ